LEFRVNSPAGCPGGSFGYNKSTSILLWLILFFGIYFAAGTGYNIKQNNLSGKEAIPNIEFWRSFPALVMDGVAYTLQTLKSLVAFVKRKISGNNQQYNDL
jgi:TRAP-type C4-dicarboxylate transport system permease small subunit